jgi:MoxR-like ATPase
MSDSAPATNDIQQLERLRAANDAIRNELRKVIVGQDDVVEQILIAIFARGHCLLVGVPGLAKTLLVSTLSQMPVAVIQRIQFTPDLMPSDITGTEVLQEDRKRIGERVQVPARAGVHECAAG